MFGLQHRWRSAPPNRGVQLGDMSICDYCTKLKRLADNLRDIGHPVLDPSTAWDQSAFLAALLRVVRRFRRFHTHGVLPW